MVCGLLKWEGSGWFAICIGDEMEDRSVVAHTKISGQRELQHV